MAPMTPERLVSLIVSLVPVLSIIATVIIAVVTRRKHHTGDDEDESSPKPVMGMTISEDDHADAAIAALTDARDEYKHRVELAEAQWRDHQLLDREANSWMRRHDRFPDDPAPYISA